MIVLCEQFQSEQKYNTANNGAVSKGRQSLLFI